MSRPRKPRRIVPRNPEAAELIRNTLFRTKSHRSEADREQQRDGWDRVAKHKNKDHLIQKGFEDE